MLNIASEIPATVIVQETVFWGMTPYDFCKYVPVFWRTFPLFCAEDTDSSFLRKNL